MTVEKLKKLLDRCNPKAEVVIEYLQNGCIEVQRSIEYISEIIEEKDEDCLVILIEGEDE